MPRFKAGSDPRTFLNNVKSKVSTNIGDDVFGQTCARYLLYLTSSDYHRQALEEEFKKRTNEALTWDSCEAIFLQITLTEQERINQRMNLLKSGRKKGESYRQFAMRISRDIRVYGIKNDNEVVLSLLCGSVTPGTLNLMIMRLAMDDKDATRFTSINAFIKILSILVGPNQPHDRIKTDSSDAGPLRNNRNGSARRFTPKGTPQSSASPIATSRHQSSQSTPPYQCHKC
ncbi:hypothetical protein BGZ54_005174, partial [Gamsiella multidivaricata]